MVQKETRLGRSEKGIRGRLVLYATQILCAFFLFHMLYTELTFKGTPSQQIKLDIVVTGRQILLDSKPVVSSEVKKDVMISSAVKIKDDHKNQSMQYLLSRLVGGEDRTELDSTGFACDNTSWSIVCVTNKPVKIDMSTMHVHLQPTPSSKNTTTIIRPYSMQESPYVMNYITPVTITTMAPPRPITCDHYHEHPAVIFSSGGYTGNLFHEFNENIIPLFITTRLLRSRVHFVVVDYKPSFMQKYRRVFPRLSGHEIINTADDSSVHCFPGAITGLKFHKFLGLNSTENPQATTFSGNTTTQTSLPHPQPTIPDIPGSTFFPDSASIPQLSSLSRSQARSSVSFVVRLLLYEEETKIVVYVMADVMGIGHGGDGAGDEPPGGGGFNRNGNHQQDLVPRKKTRGKAKNYQLDRELKRRKGKPLTIDIDKEITFHPVGKKCDLFTREAGIYMWRNIPFDREGWRNVDKAYRNGLEENLRDKFDFVQVEKDAHAEDIKGGIQQLLQRRFSDRKNKAKNMFKKAGGYEDVDRARATVPADMPDENWQKTVSHFLSPGHIKRSLTNAKCREKLKYNYRGGTSSYASRAFKEDMTRLETFYKTHTDKAGNFDSPQAEKEYNALVAEYAASTEDFDEEGFGEEGFGEEGSSSSSRPNDVTIFENVMGKRRGHIKGLGPKPSSSKAPCVFGEESQTRQYPKGYFKSFFENAEFRTELARYLASNPSLDSTKVPNEDAGDEDANDESGDDAELM